MCHSLKQIVIETPESIMKFTSFKSILVATSNSCKLLVVNAIRIVRVHDTSGLWFSWKSLVL